MHRDSTEKDKKDSNEMERRGRDINLSNKTKPTQEES